MLQSTEMVTAEEIMQQVEVRYLQMMGSSFSPCSDPRRPIPPTNGCPYVRLNNTWLMTSSCSYFAFFASLGWFPEGIKESQAKRTLGNAKKSWEKSGSVALLCAEEWLRLLRDASKTMN